MKQTDKIMEEFRNKFRLEFDDVVQGLTLDMRKPNTKYLFCSDRLENSIVDFFTKVLIKDMSKYKILDFTNVLVFTINHIDFAILNKYFDTYEKFNEMPDLILMTIDQADSYYELLTPSERRIRPVKFRGVIIKIK